MDSQNLGGQRTVYGGIVMTVGTVPKLRCAVLRSAAALCLVLLALDFCLGVGIAHAEDLSPSECAALGARLVHEEQWPRECNALLNDPASLANFLERSSQEVQLAFFLKLPTDAPPGAADTLLDSIKLLIPRATPAASPLASALGTAIRIAGTRVEPRIRAFCDLRYDPSVTEAALRVWPQVTTPEGRDGLVRALLQCDDRSATGLRLIRYQCWRTMVLDALLSTWGPSMASLLDALCAGGAAIKWGDWAEQFPRVLSVCGKKGDGSVCTYAVAPFSDPQDCHECRLILHACAVYLSKVRLRSEDTASLRLVASSATKPAYSRGLAVYVLGMNGEALDPYFGSAEAEIRRRAAESCGEAGRGEYTQALIGALEGGEAGERVLAARALGKLNVRKALPLLIRLLDSDLVFEAATPVSADQATGVCIPARQAAVFALERIAGTRLGCPWGPLGAGDKEIAQWKEWWAQGPLRNWVERPRDAPPDDDLFASPY